jgi:hypothetical protein
MDAFVPLGPREAADARADTLTAVRVACGVRDVAPEIEALFTALVATGGGECSRAHVEAVCRNLLNEDLVARTGGGAALVLARPLQDLGQDGLTSEASLARGDFGCLEPYPPSHVQMLAKVSAADPCTDCPKSLPIHSFIRDCNLLLRIRHPPTVLQPNHQRGLAWWALKANIRVHPRR